MKPIFEAPAWTKKKSIIYPSIGAIGGYALMGGIGAGIGGIAGYLISQARKRRG